MALHKNEFPILEYDTSLSSLFNFKKTASPLPEKAVYGFLGSCIDDFALSCGAAISGEIKTITKDYPIYTVNYNGEEICLCQAPMGAPAAVQNLEHLIHNGVKHIVSAGSCGVLSDIQENEFIIPVRALRDEGSSYKYLPPSRYIDLDMPMTKHICRTLSEKGISFRRCITWTTDGLFRETPETVTYRRSEGCDAVDMECASLAACAKLRDADFGMLFFTADSLADINNYDERDFGTASLLPALRLCLDIISGYSPEKQGKR